MSMTRNDPTIISIVSQKGGTGKTTTTVNLGAALALSGKRVLLIDLDPQASLSYSLGLGEAPLTITDIIHDDIDPEKVCQMREGMAVIPSDISLADIELSLTQVTDREMVIKRYVIERVKGYDFILLDCPPALSLLTLNALCASRYMVIPLQMEVLGLQGLDKILDTAKRVTETFNSSLEVKGVLPVMIDQRKNLCIEIWDILRQRYDIKVFKSYIRSNVKASEAPSFGMSVIAYAPQSSSAKDYLEFADELTRSV